MFEKNDFSIHENKYRIFFFNRKKSGLLRKESTLLISLPLT